MRASHSAIALLAGLSFQAQAAVDPETLLGRASLHVSALSYRLVDLAPDDGIAPWIMFDVSDSVRLVAAEQSRQDSVTVPAHPFGPGAAQQVGNSAAYHSSHGADGSFRTFTEVRLKDAVRHSQFSRVAAVSSGTGRFEDPAEWEWVLSPHTMLEVSGTVATSWAHDVGTLVGSELVTGPARPYDFIAVSASATLSTHLGFGIWGPDRDPAATFRTGSGTSFQLRTDGLITQRQDDPAAQEFTVSVANRYDNARRGHLRLDAGGGVQVQTMARGVPEPAGGALTLAGLAVAGLLTRLRQRRAGGGVQ